MSKWLLEYDPAVHGGLRPPAPLNGPSMALGGRKRLRRLLERLPRQEADALELHVLDGVPQQGVARALGMTQSAVSMAVKRAVLHVQHLRCEPRWVPRELFLDVHQAFSARLSAHPLFPPWRVARHARAVVLWAGTLYSLNSCIRRLGNPSYGPGGVHSSHVAKLVRESMPSLSPSSAAVLSWRSGVPQASVMPWTHPGGRYNPPRALRKVPLLPEELEEAVRLHEAGWGQRRIASCYGLAEKPVRDALRAVGRAAHPTYVPTDPGVVAEAVRMRAAGASWKAIARAQGITRQGARYRVLGAGRSRPDPFAFR